MNGIGGRRCLLCGNRKREPLLPEIQILPFPAKKLELRTAVEHVPKSGPWRPDWSYLMRKRYSGPCRIGSRDRDLSVPLALRDDRGRKP